MITLSLTCAVLAALQFVCGLALLWMLALAAMAQLNTSDQVQSVLYYLLRPVTLRLAGGLAIPLFGFPLATVVGGLLLLRRRAWVRVVYTALGVVGLAWAAYWLRGNLTWWLPVAAYIGFCVGVVWTREVSRWYAAGRPSASPVSGSAAHP